MGDVNQYEWVRRNLGRLRGPVLETGSKRYNRNVSYDYRSLLAPLGAYVGTDLAPGDGVDVVADLTADFDALPEALRGTKFGTIVSMSVMEHVRDVYKFASNLRRLLDDDGTLLVSVPWVWRFHGYPSDYWRFSPEALKFLLAPLFLDECASCVSYQQPGNFAPLCAEVLNAYPNLDADTAPPSRVGRLGQRLYNGVMRRISPRLLPEPRRVLYPTMINAYFHRRAA